ncbi:MAG: aminotransferase class V-fold PLP-dependent enzyme [Anaerolineae bacterium]|nr:aminotransferase class V-fold PLP-dependent enzyme [Anaerolineae bacterium]
MPSLKDQFLLDPDVTFLNHGSFGAVPLPVFQVYQEWQRELERQPVEFLYRREPELMASARRTLADFVNCHPDHIVYYPNATTALNAVIRSLPLSPGDQILTIDHEYGAMQYTLSAVVEARHAVLVEHPIPLPLPSSPEIIESLWSAVTPRTRAIFISHITSPTALLLPIEEIIRRARGAGILTIIDGAHGVGQLPLDISALDPDFYTSNCHKWLCAPKGAAFLYARQELHSMLKPLVISWGYQPLESRANRFLDLHEWHGTRDISAYLSVPAAIQFQEENDWEAVRSQCHTLALDTRARIDALTGFPAICPADSFVQMFACFLPDLDPHQLKRDLYDRYRIEVPIQVWSGKPLLRVSFQAYNDQADADKLLSALEELLATRSYST